MIRSLTIRTVKFAALILAGVLTACGPVAAQGTVNDVIGFLVTNQAVATGDFQKDRAAAEAARDAIAKSLLLDLTSVPLATASSGFLYRLNPELGTVERATESFGGFFVERALTPGNGHASFGVSTSTASFDHFDGRSLRDGALVTIANQFRDEAAPFDTESLILHLRSSMMTVFGSVGIGNRVEVGAAVPFVQLTLDGQRINNYRGSTLIQASGNATASGIADMALRGKVNLVAVRAGGVAVAGEVRLPTGDATNLLGAGKSSLRLMGIGSLERGAVALHGNAALVRGGISSEYDFSGALSIAVDPRVTISGETLIRKVTELHSLELVSAPHPALLGVDTFRLAPSLGAETLASIVTGVKWNVTHTLVIGGHLNFPLSRGGLTAPLTPTVALEYAF
ncbi:MAG TPA: hypothetical protein VL882_01645 [Vicinamibacterales bacterium]|jgi:hypothetical protein|nr:hypothetical protein [Vicinamibacterales bacterium]